MNKRFGWFLHITRVGVKPEHKDDLDRHILFSNVVFLCLPVVYFIFMLVDLKSYLVPVSELRFDQFVVPIVIAGCVCCLWLNDKGHTTTSRILFLILWPVLLHLVPIQLLKTPADYYLAFPLGIIFHSILIQLMFSYRKETMLYVLFLAVNFLGLIYSSSILIFFDKVEEVPTKLVGYTYYSLDALLYWLLFNLVTFYTLYIIELYVKRVNESRALIEQQKEELDAMNQNLEQIVLHRTSQLEERNEKLKQHAFFNAHLLRGPFSNLQGLIQLQEQMDHSSNEQLEIRAKVNQTLEELDDRIKEIQKVVETD